MGAYIDQSSGLGAYDTGVPNLGLPVSDVNAIVPTVDLTALLNQLNLSPQPLTSGPPPVDTSTLPTVGPIDIGLPPAPVIPSNPVITNIFNPPQPLSPTGTPSGYPLIGPPTFTVTSTTPTPTETTPTLQPPITQPPPVTVTTAGGGGAVTVNVTVNNAENIANDVIQKLQQAVTDGITGSIQQVSDITQSLFEKIGETLKNIAQTIWDALKSALQAIASQIGQIVAGIGDALKNAAEYIFKGLASIFGNLRDVLVAVINKIGPVLDSIAHTIQRINDTLIAPIANFINTTVRTIATLTIAIERDLHDGLAGIVRIPGDIASGISSIDASLNRTVQQLSQFNVDLVHSTFNTADGTNIAAHVQGIGDAITQGAGFHQIASTFSPKPIGLTDETLAQISTQLTNSVTPLIKQMLNAMWVELKGTFTAYGDTFPQPKDTGGILDPVEKAAVTLTNGAINIAQSLLSVILTALTSAAIIGEEVAVVAEYAGEQARKAIPITKLDTGQVIQAWVRKYITEESLNDELLSKGFDASRQTTLKDLSVFLADVNQAVDWWVRGVISDDDLADNFRRNGVLDRDIEVFKEAAVALISPADAILAFRRGIIDEGELDAILKTNRYTPNYTTVTKALSLRPLTLQEAIQDAEHITAQEGGGVWATALSNAPQEAADVGARDGLDTSVSNAVWRNHWNVPSIQSWVTLYFRGIRTRTELDSALNFFSVPPEMHDDVIEAFRPLIQYRSIPTFVRSGILSEARAVEILQGHGFKPEDINAIMEAATKTATKTKATAASGQVTLSIANAKTLFNDGAITEDQYVAILEQHNYTPELAKAQAEVDALNAHTKHRRQTLANYAAEVEAGVLTLDDAISQLNTQGFTQQEVATWQTKVIRALRIGTHRPSLGELNNYLKNGLITLDVYRQELVNQNWQDPWLTAQVTLVGGT